MGLNRDCNPSGGGRKPAWIRICPEGCPEFCLSAGATDVVRQKVFVKLNIDPIVRSENGQGPE